MYILSATNGIVISLDPLIISWNNQQFTYLHCVPIVKLNDPIKKGQQIAVA